MSTPETEELDASTQSSENLTVKVTKFPRCRIKFDITVIPQAVVAAYAKALKAVNKEVSIPGFRKGKAPDSFIIEKYGSQIKQEWVDTVLQTGFNEALQLTHIHPLRDGMVKRPVVRECSIEKGAQFAIEFEARPLIPTIDLEELKLKKVKPAVITQEDRDKALEQVIEQLTTFHPIEDRPVQEGDFVELDVDVLEGEEKRRVIDNQRTQVNQKGLPVWLMEKVIGLKTGESAEGHGESLESDKSNVSVPSEASAQPIPFQVTVKKILRGDKPAIDDELARKVGLQNLEELKNKIDERLEQQAQEAAYQEQVKELEKYLVEHYPVEIPQSILDADKKQRLNRYLDQLKGERSEEYFRKHHASIEETLEKASLHSLHIFFLLRKVATDHHLEVSNEDMSQEFNRQLSLIPSGHSQVDLYDKENLQKQIYSLALDSKIKRFLLDKATLVEE